jgi:carbonic anhydrase
VEQPIDNLIAGYRRFRRRYFHEEPELFASLASRGQSPAVAVVACCDSRADPAIIMDCEPGDLFTIRNVANLVPPYEPDGLHHGTSAALEFAVRILKVGHVIVMGHAQCGGIQALMEERTGITGGEFITSWMRTAARAREIALADPTRTTAEAQRRGCEQNAIQISLDNLMTFPWVRERVEQDQLRLHGWYFDIAPGELIRIEGAAGGPLRETAL